MERKVQVALRLTLAAAVLTVGAILTAGTVDAHTGTGLAGGFNAGFLHPLNGPDHLLAMVAVGLWGAFLGYPLIVALPVIFPAVMAVGGVLGIANVPFPPVEIGIALSVLLLGAVIAGAFRAPAWAACSVVGLFALFHGYAHGQELPSVADPIAYSVGFVLATGMLHVVGIAIGYVRKWPKGTVAVRGLGGLIAAAGFFFLSNAITQ
ncbi:MAG: HupE/UreJ family protein [Rhodobacteraceae bacterium]|nr:HupE/UreJ family protein [Paracoccaceae bacterium]